MNVSFVFPCLDEAATLPTCIREVRESFSADRSLSFEIVVADNGSTDGSAAAALREGARVVEAPVRGYGAALQAGIGAARGQHVVFADADGTYRYGQALALYRATVDGGAALGIAARRSDLVDPGAVRWLHRVVGTPLLTALINRIHGTAVTDCNSGFRCVDRGRWARWGLTSPGMEYASEMIVRAAAAGDRIVEVPTGLRRPPAHRRSKLRPISDGLRHLRVITAS